MTAQFDETSSGIIIPQTGETTGEETQQTMPSIPDTMPVVPVSGAVLYPFMVFPFFVLGARAEKAVDAAVSSNNFIFVAAGKDPKKNLDEIEPGELHRIGTVGIIVRMMRVPTGGIKMMVQGVQRALSESVSVNPNGHMDAKVRFLEEPGPAMSDETVALIRNMNSQLQKAVQLGKQLPQEFLAMVSELKEPGKLADLIASSLELEPGDSQQVLEQLDTEKRLNYVFRLLAGEIQILEIQNKIKTNVQTEMNEMQKKHYLREQLKAIQKELGQEDPRQSEMADLRRRIEESKMSAEAEKQALHELDRLGIMHPDSAEAGVIRTYLDWMIAVPWNKSSEERLDLARARKVLDDDHYGLEKIKDRILETLAVRKLKPDAKSPIICFVGPPGVGKTSLGQSIARALNRSFFRFSVGGVRDESEIRGHRRTYVGALPGRIIGGLKTAGANNPVFMIDEIDKMGSDFRGDPSSAMLEVLDPAQNSTFTDHYLDVPFDLSKIMFITTANVLHTIPAPLRDRMEIIHLEGYTAEEKSAIAVKYLIPRQMEANGLQKKHIFFKREAVRKIISGYTRESGVRNLEREIGKICRKVASEVASGKGRKTLVITIAKVQEFLGKPRDVLSQKRTKDEVGVVNGLAWTETGGDVLHIEALSMEGKGNLILTGQLGDVMKESVKAALSLVKSGAGRYGIEKLPGADTDIHVHVPAGAVPKDGPSAGVTMFTALVSLLSRRPVRHDIAMTGEISLRGAVLPIGGLKSKLLAAKREGITKIIVPSTNRNDIEEMKPEELRGLTIVYAESVDDILPHIFREKKAGGRPRRTKAGEPASASKKTGGKKRRKRP